MDFALETFGYPNLVFRIHDDRAAVVEFFANREAFFRAEDEDRIVDAVGGEGIFRPLRLQRPGRTAQDAAALLRGFPVPPGTILPCPATG